MAAPATKGRGSRSNRSGRYEPVAHENFDDGWSEADEAAWKEDCGARVDEEVNAYLNTPVQPVEAMFDYLYADPPPELLQQRAAAIAAEGRA